MGVCEADSESDLLHRNPWIPQEFQRTVLAQPIKQLLKGNLAFGQPATQGPFAHPQCARNLGNVDALLEFLPEHTLNRFRNLGRLA